MVLTKSFWLAAVAVLGAGLASGSGITYNCDSNVAASTCKYLNTTVAALYSSAFENANARIYITYGTTGLAETSAFDNFITYDQYVSALTNKLHKSEAQLSGLSALNTYDAAPYGGGMVKITGALGEALGFPGLTGIMADNATECTLGTEGCYNAYVTVTNDPNTPLYYINRGGKEHSDEYDFYATVEHETDEVLGTSSCMFTMDATTQSSRAVKHIKHVSRITSLDASATLGDGCGGTTPSAADLFRYNSPGHLALNSSYIGLAAAPAGAYFSYDGGATNPVIGIVGSPKYYNTLANGDDYADLVSSEPDCGTNQAVQDGEGCPGEDAGLNIHNDGRGEITVLNVLGYEMKTTSDCNGFHGAIFEGNMTVNDGDACTLNGGKITGTITQTGGTLTIKNFIVGGNVHVQGGSFYIGRAVAINGNLDIANTTSDTTVSQVCGTTVGGNLEINSNGSPVKIGSASSSCAGNVINGNLQVSNNTSDSEIYDNTVGGNLHVQGNFGGTLVFNNTITRKLQCEDNISILGGGNTAAQKLGQCAAF